MQSRRIAVLLAAFVLLLAGSSFSLGESGHGGALPTDQFTAAEVGPFTVPTPRGVQGWEEKQLRPSSFEYTFNDAENGALHKLTYAAYDMRVGAFSDDLDSAKELNAYVFPAKEGDAEQQEEYALINGFWARFQASESQQEGRPLRSASAYYFRGSGLIRISYSLLCESENAPAVDVHTLAPLLNDCAYNSDKAYLTPEDAQLSIAAKDNARALLPGKKLSFSVVFDNPVKVNAKNENDLIVWSAALADGSPLPEEITLSDNGVLEAAKGYTEQQNVVITAKALRLGTQAQYPVSVQPAAKKITFSSKKVNVYLEDEAGSSLSVSLEPDSIPASTLVWKPSRKGVVSVEQNEDGTVTLKALQAGSVELTAKDPGGRQASINVNVGPAVSNVEIKASNKAIPGGKVNLTARVSPSKAIYKAVSWSLDVGDDVAAVTKDGQLTIRSGTPVGTVITVIVTAYGAPRPITVTRPITVEAR